MLIEGIKIEVQRKWVRGLRLVVRPDGSVRVSAPMLMPPHIVEAFVRDRVEWIRQAQERQMTQPRRVLHPVSAAQRQALIDYLGEAVPRWCEIMGEAPVTIRLRNMKSQWGNCRWRERIVTFNLQLALVPHELVDYIIVHELAHLQVQNHSAAFHARVQQFIPDEVARRRTLNKILKVRIEE